MMIRVQTSCRRDCECIYFKSCVRAHIHGSRVTADTGQRVTVYRHGFWRRHKVSVARMEKKKIKWRKKCTDRT